MDNLSQGCFQISRSIFDSEIFKKPAERFKVRIYLIGQVNFKDNGLPRGSKYFKYERICRDTGVWYNVATKIMVFLKKQNMISVNKATHGCIITVLNYWLYQDMWSYQGKTQATQRQDTGKIGVDNINKNERMKEWKNNFETFWKSFPHARKWKKQEAEKYYIALVEDEIRRELDLLKLRIDIWEADPKYLPACERRLRDFTPIDKSIRTKSIATYRLLHKDKTPEEKAKLFDYYIQTYPDKRKEWHEEFRKSQSINLSSFR